MSCENYEVEIGMREHGALDAVEAAALDAHLATCAGCRAFAAGSGSIETALKERVAEEAAKVDWARLQREVMAWRRNYLLKLILAPLFLLQVPLAFLFATGHLPPRELLLAGPPSTVAIFVAYVWLVNRPFREVTAVVRGSDDLLRGYVRELRRRRLRARIFATVHVALTVCSLGIAVVDRDDGMVLYALLCVLVFGAWALYDLMLALPRLKQALEEAGQ